MGSLGDSTAATSSELLAVPARDQPSAEEGGAAGAWSLAHSQGTPHSGATHSCPAGPAVPSPAGQLDHCQPHVP